MSEDYTKPEEIKSIDQYKRILKENTVVILLIHADWCKFCQRFAPDFQSLSEEYPLIKFARVNTDNVEVPENK